MLNRLLPWLFAGLAGPLCVFLALTVPTGEVPDEAAHILRADSLRHGEVLGHRVHSVDPEGHPIVMAGVTANLGLLPVAFTFQPAPIEQKVLSRDRKDTLRQIAWDREPGFASVPNTAVYMPVFYIPAAVGLAIGQAMGGGPFQSMRTGRIVNALAFVVLGVVALVVARAGQVVLFATLALPMTVWLAGSVNPDGLMIAVAVLGAACLSRVSVEHVGRPRWPVWGAGTCLALLGAAKPCYLPLALAMLGPIAWRDLSWPTLRGPAVAVVLVIVPGLLWAVVAATTVAVPFPRAPYVAGPLWPGDPSRVFHSTDVGAQLGVLARRPWSAAPLTIGWLRAEGHHGVLGAIGVLGLLDLLLPLRWYYAWLAGLVVAAGAELFGPPQATGVRGPGALAILLGLLVSFEAILLLQYLSWSPVGSMSIEGVQGRYFLPLLPFAGVALSAARLGDWPWARGAAALLPVALVAGDAVLIAHLVVTTYYLR